MASAATNKSFRQALEAVPWDFRGAVRKVWNTYNDDAKQEVIEDLKNATNEQKKQYLLGFGMFLSGLYVLCSLCDLSLLLDHCLYCLRSS